MKTDSATKVSLLLFAVLWLAACGGGGGGGGNGGGDDGSGSTPAPANVAVIAGYNSTHLTWDTVAAATGYKVYVSSSAGTATSSITPVTVTTSPYESTGLPNWVPVYYRVSAVVGGTEGLISNAVTATPSGGYLVDFRIDAGIEEVGLAQSDTPGGPLTNIVPGAHKLPSNGVPGALYSLPSASGLGSRELGAYTSSQRATLAAAAGHYYTYVDFQVPAGRVIYRDATSANGSTVSDWAMRSNSLDGTDDRLLVSGCTDMPSAVVKRWGVLITCTMSGNLDVWASDGIAPAKHLPGSTNRDAVDISATRAITFDRSTQHLFTQLPDGTGVASVLSTDNGTVDRYLGMSPSAQAGTSGQVVFATQLGTSYRLWIQASTGYVSGQTKAPYVCKGEPGLVTGTPYSADGSKVLVLCRSDGAHGSLDTIHELAFADSNTLNNVVTPAGVTGLNAWYLPDGKVLSVGTGGTNAYTVFVDGVKGPGITPNTADYFGAIGSRAIFKLGNSLYAAPDDGSAVTVISGNLPISSATAQVVNGKIWYLDAADIPFLATADATVNVQLDTQACNGVFFSGNGVGNREFFVTSHIAGDFDTVSFDDDTGVVTPILSGATSDYGIYVP